MKTIRAKVVVESLEESHYGENGAKSSENVFMRPVYSSDPNSENYSFSQATPGGSFQLYITNPNAFGFYQEGKEYLVDFVPADANEPVLDTFPNVGDIDLQAKIGEVIEALKGSEGRAQTRQKALAITKLEEAALWLGASPS